MTSFKENRLKNMYQQIEVWERLNEYILVRYACFQNILTKKYFVQHSTLYKAEDYPNLQHDEKFNKHVEWDRYNFYDFLMSMSPEERNQGSGQSPNGYDTLQEALLAWLEGWWGEGEIVPEPEIPHILPKDKFDLERAEALLKYEPEQLIELIPRLLIFLKDWNWPVTEVIAKVLSRQKSQILIPYFIEIFHSSELIDSYWKRGILLFINRHFELEDILPIKDELISLAYHPSQVDLEEEVAEVAKDIVTEYGLA